MIKRYIVKKLKDWLGWHQIKEDIYITKLRIEGLKTHTSIIAEKVDNINELLDRYKEELVDNDVVIEVTIKESQVHKLNEFLKGLGE